MDINQLYKRMKRRRKRKKITFLTVFLILAGALFYRCASHNEPRQPVTVSKPSNKPIKAQVKKLDEKSIKTTRKPFVRKKFKISTTANYSWSRDLRVKIRSAMNSAQICFERLDANLKIKWTFRINPASGQTTDHSFTNLKTKGALDKTIKKCLYDKLAKNYPIQKSQDNKNIKWHKTLMILNNFST